MTHLGSLWLMQLFPFTRGNEMTAADIKETATKLLDYVDVTDIDLKRQIADYYLADQRFT